MKYLKGLLLPALLALAPSAAAKKDEPLIETTAFSNELVNLMYFDDSGVALVQELETGNIWRSHDAGKGWKQLKDLRGLGILKNPFDNKVAIVLGEKKHWVTYDQGENWNSFKTEYSPSPSGPIGWHAQDNKKVLIHEIEDCFTAPCLGRVRIVWKTCDNITNILADILYQRWLQVRSRSPGRGPPNVPMGQELRTLPRGSGQARLPRTVYNSRQIFRQVKGLQAAGF